MPNPYDIHKDPEKWQFYERGHEVGKSGWIYNHTDLNIERTSWNLGYLHAVQERKMLKLLMGNDYYERTD